MLEPTLVHGPRPLLLLVEDNDDDVFLMKRALRSSGAAIPVHAVGDGREAVDYLSRAAASPNHPSALLPSVIFLDLKLPYVDGFEVLMHVRQDVRLELVPVVVLTSSSEERDRRRALELGADDYLVKPPTGEMLRGVFHRLQQAGRKLDPLALPTTTELSRDQAS